MNITDQGYAELKSRADLADSFKAKSELFENRINTINDSLKSLGIENPIMENGWNDLITLFHDSKAKAEALGWLEKNYPLICHITTKGWIITITYHAANGGNQSQWNGETLLSAIQAAQQKEKSNENLV